MRRQEGKKDGNKACSEIGEARPPKQVCAGELWADGLNLERLQARFTGETEAD